MSDPFSVSKTEFDSQILALSATVTALVEIVTRNGLASLPEFEHIRNLSAEMLIKEKQQRALNN